MAELYRGHRIYQSIEQNNREVISPIAFPFDAVLDSRSAHGCSPGFENKEPKFFVRLSGDRQMWLLGRHSEFCDQWEQYLRGDDSDDEPCDCPACTAAALSHNPPSDN